MKITKFYHSCLLVQDEGKVVLFDPGNYTRESNALDVNNISRLDAIAITHEHLDHMDLPLLKNILAKFPKTPIFSNTSVKEILGKEGIVVETSENEFISLEPVPHEKIFAGPSPVNFMITFNKRFSSPGDSLTFTSCSPVLALPIQASWGSTTWAVETALTVKPKAIIPVHDWHWKDDIRIVMYERLEEFFGKSHIRFLKPEVGIPLEVN